MWTTQADLYAQVKRLWDRGDLLRATVTNAISWPLRLKFSTPSFSDLTERFDAVRNWVLVISSTPNVRIEWREWNHRIQGTQKIPSAVWVDTLQDALTFIGKNQQAQRFESLWQQTAASQPQLLQWIIKHPIQALELFDRWERLLSVVAWMQTHPRPNIYLRQVDVPGVDSKFIESNRGILTELLDLSLPPDVIDTSAVGVTRFTNRFGFLDKPARIRFRILDTSLSILPWYRGIPDITLDIESFSSLKIPVQQVFITENEANFLAFLPLANSIVIFGAGYGWKSLSYATWLHQCRLYYWGDIDTHGFAILDQLREYFPNTKSFLMDRETLLSHRLYWGKEAKPVRYDLTRLTSDELDVYNDLRFDRYQFGLRLEQERIRFDWFLKQLGRLGIVS